MLRDKRAVVPKYYLFPALFEQCRYQSKFGAGGRRLILYDANVPGPNLVIVRLFILERGGLSLDVETIDLANLANRAKAYRREVNERGEVPALRLDSGQVITEITAICEFLDEVANSGASLIGATAEERAVTRMWTRRADLEICQPYIAWWRGGPDAELFYRGNRILSPAGQRDNRMTAEQGLNRLDDDLDDGRAFLCGHQPMLADIVLYGFMSAMAGAIPWLLAPGRNNVTAWHGRMAARPASAKIMSHFDRPIIP